MISHDRTALADILARRDADRRISLSRRECMIEGGWALTTQTLKESSGVLRRYLDGASVRVTTASFYEHLIALASAAPKKVRQPPARFPRRQTPTRREGKASAAAE
jgi:hypothetical protein